MSRHVMETELALYAAGDLPFWRGAVVHFHVRRCDEDVQSRWSTRGRVHHLECHVEA